MLAGPPIQLKVVALQPPILPASRPVERQNIPVVWVMGGGGGMCRRRCYQEATAAMSCKQENAKRAGPGPYP